MSRSIHENIKQYVKESQYIYSSNDEKKNSVDAILEQLVKKVRFKKNEQLKRQENRNQNGYY